MQTAVAIQESDANNVICLLDDIANASLNLDGVLGEVKKQRAHLRSNWERLRSNRERQREIWNEIRKTWDGIRETWERVKGEQPIVQMPRRMSPEMERLAKLTPRETEVLRLIAEGFSTKAIADRLGISFKTAVCHRTHVLEKTNCHESATLVRLAINSGLVENDL